MLLDDACNSRATGWRVSGGRGASVTRLQEGSKGAAAGGGGRTQERGLLHACSCLGGGPFAGAGLGRCRLAGLKGGRGESWRQGGSASSAGEWAAGAARACDQGACSAPAALPPAPRAPPRRPTPPRACKPAQRLLLSAPQLAGHSREKKTRSPHSPINLLLGVVDSRPFAARPHHAAPWRQSPAPRAVPGSQLSLQGVRRARLTEISCRWPAVAHFILKERRGARLAGWLQWVDAAHTVLLRPPSAFR